MEGTSGWTRNNSLLVHRGGLCPCPDCNGSEPPPSRYRSGLDFHPIKQPPTTTTTDLFDNSSFPLEEQWKLLEESAMLERRRRCRPTRNERQQFTYGSNGISASNFLVFSYFLCAFLPLTLDSKSRGWLMLNLRFFIKRINGVIKPKRMQPLCK